MAIGSPQWMYSAGADDLTIDQSLRFDYNTDAHLSWTPTSAGNRKTWTFSFWVKRGNLSGVTGIQNIFGVTKSGGQAGSIKWGFNDDDTISIWDWHNRQLATEMLFRDPSAWYHIVLAWDTTQATDTNRVKLYVNGSQVTLTDLNAGTGWGGYPPEDDERYINATEQHCISTRNPYASDFELDVYLAEVNFIDGQALGPEKFGRTGDYGEWLALEYNGSYGTNGFRLPFQQDYTVEGFSAVTYTGNNSGQYIGGVGFRPDLTWFKRRDASTSHAINDSVRGIETILTPNTTAAEVGGQDAGDDLLSWETDGFVLGLNGSANSHGRNNGNGNTFVAWNWDMGGDSYGVPTTITGGGGVQHSTTQAKIGSTSIQFDGSGDYLLAGESRDYSFPSGNGTVEFWIYSDSNTGDNRGIAGTYAQNNGWRIQVDSAPAINLRTASGTDVSLSVTWSVSTWTHIALVLNNGEAKVYVNGTLYHTSTTSFADGVQWSSGAQLQFGGYGWPNTQWFDGFLDEIRISNNARYTSNFTPSTSAFSNDANTLLLIHSDTSNGSTTFVDSSGAAKNTGGSITSYVAANATYGQSIVSYEGTGSSATVGHGLSSAPELIIVKNREHTADWAVGGDAIGSWSNQTLELNNDVAAVTDSNIFGADPTSSLFTIGTSWKTNRSGYDHIAYCFHSVSGYSKFGSYTGNGSTSGPTITLGFRPAFVIIKPISAVDHWNLYDTARDSGPTVDTLLFPNRSNAEGTGQDILISDTGFQLKTTNSGSNGGSTTYLYMAFADKREYAYWLDQSGNNNDWTSNNLTESDISVDTPTNNFCTMNPLDKDGTTLSEGNLGIVWSEGNYNGIRSTFGLPSTGKWYIESLCKSIDADDHCVFGLADNDIELDAARQNHATTVSYNYNDSGAVASVYKNGSSVFSSNAAFAAVAGDIVQIAYDASANKLWFGKNNVWANSSGATTGNPSTGANETCASLASYNYMVYYNGGDSNASSVANFGQDSSFAGNRTAQGNQDSGGIGDFYYTPPTGFKALCTSNLPDVDIVPSEHFNTILWSGNSSSNTVTGMGFDAGLWWSKVRNVADSHILIDEVRGDNEVVRANSTTSQYGNGVNFTSNSDGFSMTTTSGELNHSGRTYVTWGWKGSGGSGSSNTDGDITSTVSANQDAGFSIVTYTGSGTGGDTIGHGLSKSPEITLIKKTSGSEDWICQSETTLGGWNKNLRLNTTAAKATSTSFVTGVSSSLITLGTSTAVNGSSTAYVNYNFHSVDGYSKVGSYTGNGSTDGVFLYTGFRPMFVMTKVTGDAHHWTIYNTDKATYNHDATTAIYANDSSAEGTGAAGTRRIDLLSNGFKLRHNSYDGNRDGEDYIYIAFAETPFKYSNAR